MTDMKNMVSTKGPLLAMDTSTSSLTVAVLENGTLLGELSTYADRNHSIGLMPNIQELLHSLDMKPKDLRAVVVGNGPGSYTGVRIGVTAAKTFAWSLGIDLLGVSSLEAMAFGGKRRMELEQIDWNPSLRADHLGNGAASSTWFIPLMDARRSQAFTAIYESRLSVETGAEGDFDLERDWRTFLPDTIHVMEPWLDQIANLADDAQLRRSVSGKVEWGAPTRVVFVGETEGFEAILRKFAEEWSGEISIVPHLLKAEDVGQLSYPYWRKGEFKEVHTFVPNYAQLTEAEVNLLAKAQKGEV
jgi:tRNA threonylcarbamoyladenosine biosynthesis protein TsaB